MGANCPICGDWLDERFLSKIMKLKRSFIASDIYLKNLLFALCFAYKD